MKIFRSIQFKLIIIAIGIVILSNVAIGTISELMANSTVSSTVYKLMDTVTDSAASKIKGEVDLQFRMVEALAKIDFLHDESVPLEEKCRRIRQVASVSSDYENIAFYDRDGNSFTAEGQQIRLTGRAYLDAAYRGQKTVTDPVINSITKVLFQMYVVPVYDEANAVVGALVANVYGENLSQKIAGIQFGNTTSLYVSSKISGNTVASTEIEQVRNQQNVQKDADDVIRPILTKMMAGETGVEASVFGGQKMVAAYRSVPGTDWAVLCVSPYSDFFGTLAKMRRIIILTCLVAILISVVCVGAAVSISLKPLKNLKTAITEIASGNADLTRRIELKTQDEVGDVVIGFNKFTEKLQSIMSDLKKSKETLGTAGSDLSASTQDTSASITQIIANIESVHKQIGNQSQSVQQTAGAVNEIASNIDSLENMIENQSSGVTQASAAVEQMIGNINSVNKSVDKMAESFELLAQTANAGAQKQSDVNDRISRIEGQSQMLHEANNAIAAIAEQTNLLAMNAAIEAAHAGESGKGFSVVADEIRKLSETSSVQSKSIGEQLNGIKDAITEVVSASQESSSAFQKVTEKISETDELVRQIKSAMEEQTQGSKQINEALHAMNDSTIEVRNASREMAEGNKAILGEVRNLQEVTSVMLGSVDEMSVGAKKINETGVTFTDISQRMENSILDIGSLVDQFKV